MIILKRLHKFLVAVILMSAFNTTSFAQDGHLFLKSLTTDDGLSSSNILGIIQDSKGFIWIGTYDGVNRYDGKEFKVFKNEPGNPNSLPDNLIRSLYISPEDFLYVGTNTGLSKYNNLTGQFTVFTNDSLSCLNNFNFQAYDIVQDKKGNLWIASNIGLIRFDEKGNSYEVFSHNPANENSISNSQTIGVWADNQDRIWVSTRNGFNLFVPEKKSFKRITKETNGKTITNHLFLNIVQDEKGYIWINGEDGLFRVDDTNPDDIRLFHYQHNNNDPRSISYNMLSTSYVDSQNRLWIGAENNGLFLFDREKENFIHIEAAGNSFDALKATSINAVFQDNSNNIWLGTYGHGVFIAPENGNAISVYEKFNTNGTTYSDIIVNTFYEDKKDRLWIGTDGKGLFEFNKTTEEFKNYSTKNSNIGNDYILSIAEDETGNIWLASWDGGLIKFNPEKKIFKSYTTQNSKIPDNKIYSITVGTNQCLWMGCHYGGLVRFIPETNEFIPITEIDNEEGKNTVNIIRNNGKGELYVGTTNGFLIYQPKSNRIKHYPEFERRIGIVEVNDIVFENDTSVWFATLMGIDRFNPETGRLKHYSVEDGLPGNVISGLIIDNSGILWVSTSNGICRFDIEHDNIAVYTRDDGLQSNEFKARSIEKDREGNLYFGGVNGFNIINPNKLVQNLTVPKIQITGLDIFHMPVTPASPNSPLEKSIEETEEIRLDYTQSVLTFHFASLDFTSPNKNEHAYMLENFDDDWIYCGNDHEATYTNLDPGKYIFRVKGSNNDGIWNETGASVKITIIPPWWQTRAFKIIAAVLILVFVLAVYFIRISSLKKQKQVLEESVRKRTEELAKINATKDRLFSIISHDLKNPFNIILGYAELLKNDYKSLDEETMNSVLTDLKESGESAYTLLENLLNWSRSQRGKIDFLPQKYSVTEIMEAVIPDISSLAKKKNIQIIHKAIGKDINVSADMDLLKLILRNLLTNAIKFSRPGQRVWIDVEKAGKGMTKFSVTDEGVGIEQDKASRLFEFEAAATSEGTSGEKGTGLGLVLSKEFVERHGGKIWVDSQPGKGSSFFFLMPLSEK